MKILARGFAILLTVGLTATATGQGGLVKIRAKGPDERLKLVGVVKMAGNGYGVFSEAIPLEARQWQVVGGNLAGCHVTEISAAAVTLTDRQRGRVFVFTMVPTGPGDPAESDPAKRRKDWINSGENPMYFFPFPLPPKVADRWSKLSVAEKSQVCAVYRDFGWNLVVVDGAPGKPQFTWENIYESERKAAMDQIKANFEASLNAEQRLIYARIKATIDDPTRPTKTREQVWADDAVRATEWAKLKESFSRRQRELYNATLPRAMMIPHDLLKQTK